VSAWGLLVFAGLYAVFFWVYIRFPYLESGADLVAHLKHGLARKGQPFKVPGSLRVMAFGNSKTLSGFVPSLFDQELAIAGIPGVESWNFGLPGDIRFVADLEALAARGLAPDVVLLTYPWPVASEPGPTFFHFVDHDQKVIDDLFPFRKLPRNFILMAMEAHGSPNALGRIYFDSERTVNRVEADRGYYFLERQSHYPNHKLPSALRDPTDTPDQTTTRIVSRGPVFERFAALLQAHHIRCLLVPNYFREGQFAPAAPLNRDTANLVAGEWNLGVAGPDYVLYANRFFSDTTHVNPAGAKVYTRAIAVLVAPWLKEHPKAR